jgi:soluble lytic murein transglycosylase-like protein
MALRWDKEVLNAVGQARAGYGVSLDPALVHAVIERETGHRDPSPSGTLEPNGHRSWGPMQVEDTTAAAHGIADPTSLVIPSVGIRIGAFELARLVRLYPGDTPRAIAAYNAGSGNSQRNAAGRFVNQSYVDAVLSFFSRFSGVAGGAFPAVGLIALVALGAWLLSRRRRLAWR